MSFWTDLFKDETERNLEYALYHGYKVLPIAIPGSTAYGVYNKHNHLLATCVLIEYAAQIAAALAMFTGVPVGTISSQSQAGESLAPGLAEEI